MVVDTEPKERYIIPNNFIESGKVFGGQFKVRNVVEGIIMAIIVGLVALIIPAKSTASRLSIELTLSLPFLLLGVVGINDDPLSTFLLNVRRWRKTKTIMLYDNKVKPTTAQLVDMMLAEEAPAELLMKKIKKIQNKHKAKNAGESHVEGIDFVFAEDRDLYRFKTPEEREELSKQKAANVIKKKSKNLKTANSLNIDDIVALTIDEKAEKYDEHVYEIDTTQAVELSADDLLGVGNDFLARSNKEQTEPKGENREE